MTKIETYVFFDIETTGLPHEERNKTKITELCFVAVLREHMKRGAFAIIPPVSKLTLLINPQKKINPIAEKITGLSNDLLKNAPIFQEYVHTIVSYLSSLPKPICLVAHNGDRFDYKILLAEFLDANATLPHDLLCVDSLTGFRQITKNSNIVPSTVKKDDATTKSSSTKDDSMLEEDSLARDNNSFISEDSLISEDWPDLDVSVDDWKEIDSLCSSFSEMPIDANKSSSNSDESKVQPKNVEKGNEKISYALVELYKRIVKKEVYNAHRAEDDCFMLMECVVATKEFLLWAEKSCKSIHDITPLDRHKYDNKTSSPC